MWFDAWSDMWRVFIIAAAIYAFLVLILRTVGKRSLAKLNIFDFVVTVALGSALATIILSKDVSFAEGALAFAMLCGLQWLVAWFSLKVRWFKKLTRSDPRLLFSDGKFLDRAMRDERILRQEVYAEIRSKSFGDLEDIAAVVLETDGTFSVIPHSQAKTRSAMKTVTKNPEDPAEDAEPAR
jgi:uncharacterized membrane protein YcaP (DUF421 family)